MSQSMIRNRSNATTSSDDDVDMRSLGSAVADLAEEEQQASAEPPNGSSDEHEEDHQEEDRGEEPDTAQMSDDTKQILHSVSLLVFLGVLGAFYR
ncbi:unnamed protein product [Sympodiomycopsis kandeliae]